MGEVFAGFVCGYILALAAAPVLALGASRLRRTSALVARLVPEGQPVVPLMVVLHGGLMVLGTGAGLILGMVLFAMRETGPAFGSPHAAFTLLVFGLTVALFAPIVVLAGSYRLQALLAALAVLALFGWLMPYMAQWSKFGSS